MSLSLLQVDAFTDTPFAGNPAAVCMLRRAAAERWMQDVAREMNLSETAFLVRRDDGGYDLRWFTPTVEVELCGHATLASAHVLWEDKHLAPDATAHFHTLSGVLTAERRDGWIWMDFPAEPALEAPAPPELARALRAEPLWVGRNRFDLLVEVESEATVRALQPDLGLLAEIPARGVIVTAAANDRGKTEYDFVSRFFGPRAGVDEDPVTGSAHCALAPFWAARFGRPAMVGWQASARGGTVRVRHAGSRVHLGGQAVTVLRATLVVPPG